MTVTTEPGTDKKPEGTPAPAAVKAEGAPDNQELDQARAQVAALERKLAAATRKGKTAEELEAALAKREEEWADADKQRAEAITKRDKLLEATLKPRLESLPEHTRKLVKLAGKEGPEALIEALELAEKDATKQVAPVQGGPLPSTKQTPGLVGEDGQFDTWGGFAEIAKSKTK